LNNTATALSVSSIADGSHNWSITCKDQANNSNSSALYNFTVDTTAPSLVNLTSPADLFRNDSTSAIIMLNFTAVDALSSTMNCSLYVDGVINQTNATTLNNTNTNFTVLFAHEGTYTWNVTCKDQANNSNSSSTRTLYIGPASSPTLPSSPSNPDPKVLSISHKLISDENKVELTVTGDDGGATVKLYLWSPVYSSVGSGTTKNQKITFPLTDNGTYKAVASKSGYQSAETTFVFTFYTAEVPVANITNVTINDTSNISNQTTPDKPPNGYGIYWRCMYLKW